MHKFICCSTLFIVILLTACEGTTTPVLEDTMVEIDTVLTPPVENLKKKAEIEEYSKGFWIGKSYYNALRNGTLTNVFIDNHLKTYVEEGQIRMDIGNAYGSDLGTVLLKNERYIFKTGDPDAKEDTKVRSFIVYEKDGLQELATSSYWGYGDEEGFFQDSIYIKIMEDSAYNQNDGWDCVEKPVELLYFTGEYEVTNEKSKKDYLEVTMTGDSIKNFRAKNVRYNYVTQFSGEKVVCLDLKD